MCRLLVAVIASLLVAEAASKTSYEGYKVYNCQQVTDDQMKTLLAYSESQGHDVWFASRTEHRAEVMVAPHSQREFQAFLDQHQIQHEVLIKNVQRTIRYENHFSKLLYEDEPRNITFNKYHSFSKINDYLAQMAATYPSVASVEVIGQTTEGRLMKVLKISRGGNNPVIWIDAGIHAREWIAPAMALYVINQLLENPANSALLDGVDWHILPVVNPDGYQWSFTNDRFWRKTRSRNTCDKQHKAGVDANRNWNFHWNSSNAKDKCTDIYPGPHPFSEPEVVAISNFLLANKERLKFYLSFHSFGPYIFIPWAWTTEPPSDRKTLLDLAHRANAAQMAAGGKSASIGTPGELIYKAAGSSYDWARGVAGVNLSFTIELPGGGIRGFDLPANEIEATVAQYFQAVRVFWKHVRDNCQLV